MNENSVAHEAGITGICVDMHCHSSYSDGALPPAGVAEKLFERGVKFAALTDHNTLEGLKPFSQALAKYDIGYIAGVEIATQHHDDVLHILAYGFDEDNAELKALFDGETSNTADEFISLKIFMTSAEIIDLIHRAGGIAVLAHPLVTQPDFQKFRRIIDELKIEGLDGIEALYGSGTPEQNDKLIQVAQEQNLVPTAGTDFHDPAADTPGMTIDIRHWNTFRDALLHTARIMRNAPEPQISKQKRKNIWFGFAANMILPAVLSLVLLIAALFVFLLPYYENTLMNTKRENIRQLSQVAYGVLSEAVAEEQSGELTLEEAQALAKNRISAMRYGIDNKDYFWLQDTTPRILMHPYRTNLNDQDVSAFVDSQGNKIFVAFSDLALSKGEGFVSYVWQWMDDPDRLEAKESYIRYFEPWGWIIGTGIYANDVQAEISHLRAIILIISSGVIGVVLVLLAYLLRQGALLEKSKGEAMKLLVESTQRYKTLSEAATEGALYVSGGRCRYANAVLYEILGCASHRIDLLYLRDVFPDIEGNAEWLRMISDGAENEGERAVSGVIRRCDGSLLSCSLAIKEGLNDCSDGLMILVRRKGEAAEHSGTRVALDRLLHIPGMLASELTDAISKANRADEVASLCRNTSEVVVTQLENGTSSIVIAHMIAAISDFATRRLIELAVREIGTPPAPFAFLALGSQGRQAQTLFSDQDNALIYRPGTGENDPAAQAYFLKLATAVCDHLELAGYAKCEGGMIASNPKWCKPISEWKSGFVQWIREAKPRQIVEFCTMLDFRTVYGAQDLESEIRDVIYDAIKDDRLFIRQMAQNAVSFRTPQRLFGSIKASGGIGIDIKIPAFAIVSFARFYAIKHGIKEPNTLLQLDAIKRLGVISDARHRDVVAAYELLLRLRLWNQVLAIENNEKLDHYIEQSQLGKVEGIMLRASLREIEALQGMIERNYLGLV